MHKIGAFVQGGTDPVIFDNSGLIEHVFPLVSDTLHIPKVELLPFFSIEKPHILAIIIPHFVNISSNMRLIYSILFVKLLQYLNCFFTGWIAFSW